VFACSVVSSCFHCPPPFFRVLILSKMGMLNCFNPEFKFSHFTQVSEFVIDEHHYTSPNQQEGPPTISIDHSRSLPDDAPPSQLLGHIWALDKHPYLPYILSSPFEWAMTSCLATPFPVEIDGSGHHLSNVVIESWRSLENFCNLYMISVILKSPSVV
jgi:hypothetical protein